MALEPFLLQLISNCQLRSYLGLLDPSLFGEVKYPVIPWLLFCPFPLVRAIDTQYVHSIRTMMLLHRETGLKARAASANCPPNL